MNTLYAIVKHTSGSGDFGGYLEWVLPDHVYASIEHAEYVRDRLNRPTWEIIQHHADASLTSEYLGYGGYGWNLDYYTITEIAPRAEIDAHFLLGFDS